MSDYKEQGLAIRGTRIGRHMTQAHLATLAGVSEKTVRRAEAGERLQPDSIRALCAALGLDASELRTETEMQPDVSAQVSSALFGQAVRVRTLTRVFAMSGVLLGTLVIFRDRPWAWETGTWICLALALSFFGSILVSLFLEAAVPFSARARSAQAWTKPWLGCANGFLMAAFLPGVLIVTAASVGAAIVQPTIYTLGLAALLVYCVWGQAGMVANEVLDLEGDPKGDNESYMTRVTNERLASLIRTWVFPVIHRWLDARKARATVK